MQTLTTVKALRHAVAGARATGKRIAFVPTMGNLHEGHLRLVRKALTLADRVVVSIFVNPLQFGPNEDFAAYPRTLSADKEKLFAAGAHFLFAPSVDEMYPAGLEPPTQVHIPGISETLCGESRPGHFTGVATVVSKLFNIVQPDVAVFGEKDYQQLLVIRKLVRDLCMPIEVVGVPTARAGDGLALSSRNGYLAVDERARAPRLHEVLREYREAIASGFDNYTDLERYATEDLRQAGFEPEYVSIRDARTLGDVTDQTEAIVILAAARLGRTRLIDNVTLTVNPASDWGMLATR